MLKVGVDLTSLKPSRVTGLEVYALNLAVTLFKMGLPSTELNFYFAKSGTIYASKYLKGARNSVSPVDNRIYNDQMWLPYVFNRDMLDFMYYPAFPPSPLLSRRSLLTIPDTTLWDYPETSSFGGRYYYKRLYEFGLARAKRVLTISETSKARITDLFHVTNVQVARCSLDRTLSNEDPGSEDALKIRARFGLPDRVILFVGTVEPRKNLSRLIRAFLNLDQTYQSCVLMIAGRIAWGGNLVQEFKNAKSIVFSGYLDKRSLAACYQLAEFVVLPSLYEGFGLPILEAFHFEKVVCCSTIEAHLEVAGDAAMYFDPFSTESITKALSDCLSLTENQKIEFVAKQKGRMGLFSWEKSARSIANCLENL